MTKEGKNGTLKSYICDGNNLRTSKTVNGTTTEFLYDGTDIIGEKTGAELKTYVRGDKLLSDSDGKYYHYDTHGSVSALTNAQNEVLAQNAYDAYGAGSVSPLSPFGYCGEYLDNETGFVYLRNRYYDPNTGRFISQDPIKDGDNWYVYANNNPIMFVDPTGFDAIVVTNGKAAFNQGHTSAIYQDANGEWFYTYWGNKAAAIIHISNEYMSTLSDFNNGLNKFLTANGFKDITSDYNSSTYIVGDFTASLDIAYDDVKGAHSNIFHKDSKTQNLGDGSIVFQGQNSPYNLSWNNCLDRTYNSLCSGTLSNGKSVKIYMESLGFNGGLIPNNATSKFSELFMNSSFTYNDAHSSLLNYATLYVQKSPWAQKWEKANYANSVVGW